MSDHSESEKIALRLKSATRKLRELAAQVGSARQIREYDGDRRKQILAIEVVKSIKAGESAAAADVIGRASEAYKANLAALAEQYEAAEVCIATWAAEQAAFEASRSLLSFTRESMKNLEG